MIFVLSDIFGILGGIFGMISSIPQVYKTIKTNKTKDIHLCTCLLRVISSISWILFAYLKIQYVMIFSSFIVLFVESILIFFIYKSRNNRWQKLPSADDSDNNDSNTIELQKI